MSGFVKDGHELRKKIVKGQVVIGVLGVVFGILAALLNIYDGGSMFAAGSIIFAFSSLGLYPWESGIGSNFRSATLFSIIVALAGLRFMIMSFF